VCIMTGSATGTGAACAERPASKGARVAINYTKSEKEAHNVAAAVQQPQPGTGSSASGLCSER
jgi:NAD(P)-dependent dehydrogenase (short-subunit alcohol dehydrogenase family)